MPSGRAHILTRVASARMRGARRPPRASRPNIDAIIGQFWSLEDPWRPGFDIEFKNSGRKRVERVRCWHIPGPTYLDELIALAAEAVTLARNFLDDGVNERVDYKP